MACPDRIPVGGFQGEIIQKEVLPARPENNFVRFLSEQNECLTGYTIATRLLAQEEQTWRASPMVDVLLRRQIKIVQGVDVSYETMTTAQKRQYRGWRETYVHSLFDTNSLADEKNTRKEIMYQRRLPYERQQQLQELYRDNYIIQEQYAEIRRPLVEAVSSQREELQAAVEAYMNGGYNNVEDFARFLEDERFDKQRADIRAFLRLIARRVLSPQPKNGNTLEKKRQMYAEALKHKPTADVLESFLANAFIEDDSIFVTQQGEHEVEIAVNEELMKMTAFLAAGMKAAMPDINNEKLQEMVTDDFIYRVFLRLPVSLWPTVFSHLYDQYIDRETMKTVTTIRRGLEKYKQPETKRFVETPIFTVPHRKEKTRGQAFVSEEEIPEEQETEEYRYGIGLLAVNEKTGKNDSIEMDEEEIDNHAAKIAKGIAKKDTRMARDIRRIIDSLQSEPYALGTAVLSFLGTGSADKSGRLRRLDPRPRKKFGLVLEHEESDRLRIVYAIIKREEGKPIIAIEGIYHHDDYSDKFDLRGN